MRTPTKVAAVAAGVAASAGGAFAARRRLAARSSTSTGDRWMSVTVNKSPDEAAPDGRLPEPLASLGGRVEVRVTAAPGDKGTEIAARPRAGQDLDSELRTALRESKQLLEVGEVLRLEPIPHGQRPATLAGKLVDVAARRAPEKGVL